jgi:pimeloyl-ACP methyl ester carboxylesterase
MENYLPVFRSPEGERLVLEAYESVIKSTGCLEEIYIPTFLGMTHILSTGPVDAPPLILVHAFYASAASWYRNVNELALEFRVFLVDIIGDPNRSKPLRLIRDMKDYVQWFNEVLNGLELDSAYFAGNSVGGFHLANLAMCFPEKVKKLILIGPAATFLPMFPFYMNTFPGGMTGWTPFVRHAVKWVENRSPFEDEFRLLFFLLMKYGKSANQVFPAVFSDHQLTNLNVPVLLIFGEREVIYNINKAIDRAMKLMPDVSAQIIPGGNHLTAVSRPDAVNRAIRNFLLSVN